MKKAGELGGEGGEAKEWNLFQEQSTYISLRTVRHGSNSTWYFYYFCVRVRYSPPTEIKMVTVSTGVIQTNKEDLELH